MKKKKSFPQNEPPIKNKRTVR